MVDERTMGNRWKRITKTNRAQLVEFSSVLQRIALSTPTIEKAMPIYGMFFDRKTSILDSGFQHNGPLYRDLVKWNEEQAK